MAAKADGETNGCTFQWKIENLSHCWVKELEDIWSPAFIADALEGTKWSLRLILGNKYVTLYLYRAKDCSGPDKIQVNSKLAFLDKDGSFLREKISNYEYQKYSYGNSLQEERKKVFSTGREAFLPNDTLTVQCTIWNRNEIPVKTQNLFARTVLKVKRRSFVWKIDKFSTLKPGVLNKFKDDLVDFDIVLKKGLDSEKNLAIDGISFDKSITYFSFKIAVIDSVGKEEHYGSQEYFTVDLKKGISSTLLFTRMLIENKSRYLPNDILSLDCEYLYATGTVADQFGSYGIITPKVTKVNTEEIKEHFVEEPNIQLIPVLVNDFKSMYIDGIFSDVELRTPTQNFPAHKGVLSSRSPVFRRMFSNDMRENTSGHIDITDLEDDTVHRMLLYLYTDSLEDLQYEKACKLYLAADKYEIMSLRSRCSSFLKDSLCPNKACDILVLADRHQDDDLKGAVQDFILRHDEVFGSQEWKDFMATNIQLAADIMYKKIYPG